MSTKVLDWAFDLTCLPNGRLAVDRKGQPMKTGTLPMGAKFVLVALADNASDEGYCYPGQAKIARRTGMTDRSVRSHVEWLEDNGLIERTHRYDKAGNRTSDGYWLTGYMAAKGIELPENTAPPKRAYRKPTHSLPEDVSGRPPEKISTKPSVLNRQVEPSVVTETHVSVRKQLFEAINRNWIGGHKPTKGQAGLIGKVVSELMEVDATPSQVDQQWALLASRFENMSPAALTKHWNPATSTGVEDKREANRRFAEDLKAAYVEAGLLDPATGQRLGYAARPLDMPQLSGSD